MTYGFLKFSLFALLLGCRSTFCDDNWDQFKAEIKEEKLKMEYCMATVKLGSCLQKAEAEYRNQLNSPSLFPASIEGIKLRLKNDWEKLEKEQAELEEQIIKLGRKPPSCDECKEILALAVKKCDEIKALSDWWHTPEKQAAPHNEG